MSKNWFAGRFARARGRCNGYPVSSRAIAVLARAIDQRLKVARAYWSALTATCLVGPSRAECAVQCCFYGFGKV